MSTLEAEQNPEAQTSSNIRLPEPSQYVNADVFVNEQGLLREQNRKRHNGLNVLMISHW